MRHKKKAEMFRLPPMDPNPSEAFLIRSSSRMVRMVIMDDCSLLIHLDYLPSGQSWRLSLSCPNTIHLFGKIFGWKIDILRRRADKFKALDLLTQMSVSQSPKIPEEAMSRRLFYMTQACKDSLKNYVLLLDEHKKELMDLIYRLGLMEKLHNNRN